MCSIVLICLLIVVVAAIGFYYGLRNWLNRNYRNIRIIELAILFFSSTAILGGLLDVVRLNDKVELYHFARQTSSSYHGAKNWLNTFNSALKTDAIIDSVEYVVYPPLESINNFFGDSLKNRVNDILNNDAYFTLRFPPFSNENNWECVYDSISNMGRHDINIYQRYWVSFRDNAYDYNHFATTYNYLANKYNGDDRGIWLNIIYCIFFLISISLSIVRILAVKKPE